jgi:hypothetical protein
MGTPTVLSKNEDMSKPTRQKSMSKANKRAKNSLLTPSIEILNRPMLGKDLLAFKEENNLTLSMTIAITGVACPRIWYQFTRDEAKEHPLKDKSTALLLRLLMSYPEYHILSVKRPNLEQIVNDLGIDAKILAVILGRTELTGKSWGSSRGKTPRSIPSQPVTNLLNIIEYQINEYKKGSTKEDPKAFLRKIRSLLLLELDKRGIDNSKIAGKTDI